MKVYRIIDGKPVEQPGHPLVGMLDAGEMQRQAQQAVRRNVLFGGLPTLPPVSTAEVVRRIVQARKAMEA